MSSSSISQTSRRGVLKGILAGAAVGAPIAADAKPLSDQEQLEHCLSQIRDLLTRMHPRSHSPAHSASRHLESRPDGSWRLWMRGDVDFEDYSGEGLYEVSLDGWPITFWLTESRTRYGEQCYRATYWEDGRLMDDHRDLFTVQIMRKLDWRPA